MKAYIEETVLVTPKAYRREIFEAWNSTCGYCGKEGANTLDHIVAESKQGTKEKNNLVPCCGSCNLSKGNASMEDWYTSQEFFDPSKLERLKEWTKSPS